MINATCSDACSVDLFWVLFRVTPLYKFIMELARISLSLSLSLSVTPVEQLRMKLEYHILPWLVLYLVMIW